jgi:hypothetical protein
MVIFADNPEVKVEILKRIVQGDTVIDQEAVSLTSRRRFTAIAIYRVKDGKIETVWFVR